MLRISLLLLMVVSFQLCERRTVVKLEGGRPPTFVLSGSGRLGEVMIFGPDQEPIAESNPFDETHALWKIAPEKDGEANAKPVEEVGRVTYGVVPPGYKQIKPKTGEAAPLLPGARYRYWFVTINSAHGSGYFEIRDGKAVMVSGP